MTHMSLLLASVRGKNVHTSLATSTPLKECRHKHLPPFITPSHGSILAALARANDATAMRAGVHRIRQHRDYRSMPLTRDGYLTVEMLEEDGVESTLMLRLTPVGERCLAALHAGYVWFCEEERRDLARTEAYWRKHLSPRTASWCWPKISAFAEPELQPLVRDALFVFMQRE